MYTLDVQEGNPTNFSYRKPWMTLKIVPEKSSMIYPHNLTQKYSKMRRRVGGDGVPWGVQD